MTTLRRINSVTIIEGKEWRNGVKNSINQNVATRKEWALVFVNHKQN